MHELTSSDRNVLLLRIFINKRNIIKEIDTIETQMTHSLFKSYINPYNNIISEGE